MHIFWISQTEGVCTWKKWDILQIVWNAQIINFQRRIKIVFTRHNWWWFTVLFQIAIYNRLNVALNSQLRHWKLVSVAFSVALAVQFSVSEAQLPSSWRGRIWVKLLSLRAFMGSKTVNGTAVSATTVLLAVASVKFARKPGTGEARPSSHPVTLGLGTSAMIKSVAQQAIIWFDRKQIAHNIVLLTYQRFD